MKDKCYKLIGYPPRGRGMGKFGSGNQGFKPQAMNVVGASNVADFSNALFW